MIKTDSHKAPYITSHDIVFYTVRKGAWISGYFELTIHSGTGPQLADIFVGQNDRNMLLYYFWGGIDDNLLLYLTSKEDIKNFGGLQWPCCLVQCECHKGKYPDIARNKSFNRNWAPNVRFSGKFWFLVPISRGCKCPLCPPCGRPWRAALPLR